MNHTFLLEIISPEGIIFQDQVTEAILPTPTGQIAILPSHAPLFSKLDNGEIIVKKNSQEQIIGITGGFLQVQSNVANILADYAIRAEDIEIAKAQEAKIKAQEILAEKKEKTDFLITEKELQRSILELKIAEKVRRRPKPL